MYYNTFMKEHKKPAATENYPEKEHLKINRRRLGPFTYASYKFPQPRGYIYIYI
jgi:hypothetical protein